MRYTTLTATVLSVLAVTTACSSTENSALRQIQPNTTVYIDGYNQAGDEGDRALVEQKPSGMWVVPIDAPFRASRVGGFTVRVTLDPRRGFVVTDLGGIVVGRDHDNCLEAGETYAFLDVPATGLRWETPKGGSGGDNDDCQVIPTD
ncbi:hypothetical protein [Thermomonospora umbrina]|uniref:Lipoprotein n=1 Tax=Thermomonospora umbrina TaxID=111806 RepID=A0A3D9SJ44_9ACTN|nr:hypothetical protein [Thermomonospora umbrina]REE95919.1 hypothetical protein DFJ69_1333 [Thermomonospora umbrina]